MAIIFPDVLNLEALESTSEEYSILRPELERIDLFYSGGYRIKKEAEKFIKPRVGEEFPLYQERLSKFSYRNVFASAVRLQVSRMSNSSITTSVDDADTEWWNRFRDNTNRRGRTERDLVACIFRELLKFKTVWLHVDRPSSLTVPLNAAQEQILGLDPYINMYSALEVISQDQSDTPTWVKLRQISKQVDPFGGSVDVATWTYITDSEIAKYSAYVAIDGDGNITGIYDRDILITDRDTPIIPIVSPPVQHGFGGLPIVKIDLPDDLWIGDEASMLAYRLLRETCHCFDLLTSGYFQRSYDITPTPDDDLSETYEDDEPPSFGMQFIPKLAKFEWSEPQGNLIVHLFKSIEDTAKDIKESVALMGATAEAGTGVSEQSGVSKRMDYVMSNELLGQFGSIIADGLQDAYQLVQIGRGRNPNNISVSGLSNFEIDSFDLLVTRLASLNDLDVVGLEQKLSPSLFLLILEKIADGLTGNLTPDQRSEILTEISNRRTPNNV